MDPWGDCVTGIQRYAIVACPAVVGASVNPGLSKLGLLFHGIWSGLGVVWPDPTASFVQVLSRWHLWGTSYYDHIVIWRTGTPAGCWASQLYHIFPFAVSGNWHMLVYLKFKISMEWIQQFLFLIRNPKFDLKCCFMPFVWLSYQTNQWKSMLIATYHDM